jgi:molybdopterin/thiamine biosynthesis adenylyltransferase
MTLGSTLPPRRLLEELRAISTRYPDMVSCSTATEPLTFEGVIEVEGQQHRVRLILTASYPRVPPQLHELDFETGEEIAEWGRPHWLPGLGLCLFPHGNDEQAWRQDRLAVEALDRFCEFIKFESQRETVAVATAADRIHLPRAAIARLDGADVGVLLARRSIHGGDFYVTHVQLLDGEFECCVDRFDRWGLFLPIEVPIPWATVSSDSLWHRIVRDPEKFDWEKLAGDKYEPIRSCLMIAIGRGIGSSKEIVCFQRRFLLSSWFQFPVVIGTPSQALFHRVDGVIHHREHLDSETIFIVGLGSLGGAVAIALARAGLRRFVLIDPDRLGIENVCRHIGDLNHVGRPKVEVVGESILRINPEAHVQLLPAPLAWDIPPLGAGLAFEQLLAQTPGALVISTCAEHRVEAQLNDVAVRAGVPVIYASALGAAEHARIFRVLPDQTPCYECIISAQDADPIRHPRFGIDGVDAERRPAYLAPELPGLGIDLMEVSMITARFALQTIAKLRDVDLGLPREHGDHLLWTSRGGWVFDRPLQLTVEHFPRSPTCPVCGPSAVHGDLDEADAAELEALAAQLRREGPSKS